MSHEQLYTHWQRGVVPWDTYVQHACAQACLPHQEMPEPNTQRNIEERTEENLDAKRASHKKSVSEDDNEDDNDQEE